MSCRRGRWIAAWFALVWTSAIASAAPLVISELMYHPPGTNLLEEWFELHNPDPAPVDLSGWQVTKGVHFTVPTHTVIAANGYLVVAADAATFAARHPAVANFVGGWTGSLSDSGDTVEVQDLTGTVRAQVTYATEGDWAVRRLAAPDRYGKVGWEWFAAHKGGGSSAELVNEALPLSAGQNWVSSTVLGGTPGAPDRKSVV